MTGPGASMPIDASGAGSPARRPRLLATLVVVIALLTGILVGVAADRRLGMHGRGQFGGHFQQVGRGPRGPWGGGGEGRPGPPDRIRQRFATELGLSPTQMAQVDSIMARSMAERRAFEDSIRPRMHGMLDATRSDIERVLTPDQRRKFEAWRSRNRGGG